MGYPEYSSKKSKRMYSDHAKVALLIVMSYTGRSFAEFTRILPSLYGVIDAAEISDIPEESTLRKFRGRFDKEIMDTVLAHLGKMITGNSESTTATDATGMPTTHASRHYITRLKHFGTEKTVVRGYTKMTLTVCVHTKAVLAADTAGSRTADVKQFEPTLMKLVKARYRMRYMTADKGYDAEYIHKLVKKYTDAEAVIPARGSKNGTRTRGVNRNRMKRELTDGSYLKGIYNLRVIVETVNSMIKRVLGEVLRGRNEETRHAEAMFRCMAHNFRVGQEISNSGMLV
jgi:hypothetical protein